MTLSHERQSARMSKITNKLQMTGLTRSGTGCFSCIHVATVGVKGLICTPNCTSRCVWSDVPESVDYKGSIMMFDCLRHYQSTCQTPVSQHLDSICFAPVVACRLNMHGHRTFSVASDDSLTLSSGDRITTASDKITTVGLVVLSWSTNDRITVVILSRTLVIPSTLHRTICMSIRFYDFQRQLRLFLSQVPAH